VHPAVAGLEALVEQRVQPVEVLDPGLVRVGRGQVHVRLHREVRRELQVRVVGQGRELQKLGDAPDPRGVGVDDVDPSEVL